MDTVITTSVTLQTIKDLWPKRNNGSLYNNIFIEDDDIYPMTRNYLEEQGDLEDLYKILCEQRDYNYGKITRKEPPLSRCNEIHNFIQASYGIISHEECRKIETIKNYHKKYPALVETFIVWAWG